MLAFLLIIGTVLGLTIGALGHPAFYNLVFGGGEESADHDGSSWL